MKFRTRNYNAKFTTQKISQRVQNLHSFPLNAHSRPSHFLQILDGALPAPAPDFNFPQTSTAKLLLPGRGAKLVLAGAEQGPRKDPFIARGTPKLD